MCKSCGFSSNKKRELKEHLKVSHDSKLIICGQCDFEGKSRNMVKYHLNKVHKLKSFSCELCGYVAYYKGSITIHMKTVHNKSASRPCDLCEFVGPPYYLRDHKRKIHKTVLCEECDYRATSKKDLINHKEYSHDRLRERLNLTQEQYAKFLATIGSRSCCCLIVFAQFSLNLGVPEFKTNLL